MGGLPSKRILGYPIEKKMQRIVGEALDSSCLEEIMQLAGAEGSGGEAGAALKAVLTERIIEYTIKAMRQARKKGIRLGAAAVIIGSRG